MYVAADSSVSTNRVLALKDGKEFFYRGGPGSDNKLRAVSITTTRSFAFGNERLLPVEGLFLYEALREYDIVPDGHRILVLASADTTAGAAARPRINVVLNWLEELKERVTVK